MLLHVEWLFAHLKHQRAHQRSTRGISLPLDDNQATAWAMHHLGIKAMLQVGVISKPRFPPVRRGAHE